MIVSRKKFLSGKLPEQNKAVLEFIYVVPDPPSVLTLVPRFRPKTPPLYLNHE